MTVVEAFGVLQRQHKGSCQFGQPTQHHSYNCTEFFFSTRTIAIAMYMTHRGRMLWQASRSKETRSARNTMKHQLRIIDFSGKKTYFTSGIYGVGSNSIVYMLLNHFGSLGNVRLVFGTGVPLVIRAPQHSSVWPEFHQAHKSTHNLNSQLMLRYVCSEVGRAFEHDEQSDIFCHLCHIEANSWFHTFCLSRLSQRWLLLTLLLEIHCSTEIWPTIVIRN